MWEEVFSIALTNGIFACLFVALLVYELKDSRAREKKYQNTIDVLGIMFSSIEQIKQDVDDIKQVVVYKKGKKSSENI